MVISDTETKIVSGPIRVSGKDEAAVTAGSLIVQVIAKGSDNNDEDDDYNEVEEPAEVINMMLSVKRRRERPRKNLGQELEVEAVGFVGKSPFHAYVKRGRGRPRGTSKLQLLGSQLGAFGMDTAGGNFTPHILELQPGEDIARRIVIFARGCTRAVCILSANGLVSSFIIRRPCSSASILKFEGMFETLYLRGTFLSGDMTDAGANRTKRGTLSVSLSKSNGRIIGGAVAGPLIAGGPFRLILGTFKQNISKEIRKYKSSAESSTAVGNNNSDNDNRRATGNINNEIERVSPLRQVAAATMTDDAVDEENICTTPTSALMPSAFNDHGGGDQAIGNAAFAAANSTLDSISPQTPPDHLVPPF